MLKSLLIAAIIALCTFAVNAVPAQTVQEMVGNCREPDQAPEKLFCIGQASGVMGMLMVNAKEPISVRMCATGFISNGQAIQIFLNWADRNPTKWQLPSSLGFAYSLREAYPCK